MSSSRDRRAFLKLTIQRRRDERAAAETFLRWASTHRDRSGGIDSAAPEDREAMLANASAILAEIDVGTGEELKLERLASIGAPITLVVGGRSDRVFAKAVRRLDRALPDASVELLPRAGHAIQLEQPEELAATVRAAAS